LNKNPEEGREYTHEIEMLPKINLVWWWSRQDREEGRGAVRTEG